MPVTTRPMNMPLWVTECMAASATKPASSPATNVPLVMSACCFEMEGREGSIDCSPCCCSSCSFIMPPYASYARFQPCSRKDTPTTPKKPTPKEVNAEKSACPQMPEPMLPQL